MSSIALSLDKPSYSPGDKITLTAVRSPGAIQTQTITVTVTGQSGDSSSKQFTIAGSPGESLSISDTANHAWSTVSDDGTTAVYTTTA
jgi:hypothetical protein